MHKVSLPLRMLWLKCDTEVAISNHLSFFAPANLLKASNEELKLFIQRVVETGHNALLFGLQSNRVYPASLHDKSQCYKIWEMLRAYGIKICLKPHVKGISFSPADPQFLFSLEKARTELEDEFSIIDYIVWESRLWDSHYFSHPSAKDALLSDLVLQEAHLLEKKMLSLNKNSGLIFYVPALNFKTALQAADILKILSNEVERGTVLAFPAVAGRETSDYLIPHPYWKELRNDESSSADVLPIINTGALWHGEGLWPSVPFDFFDEFYISLSKHPFKGIISLLNQMPKGYGFLDLNLWVAGQYQLKGTAPRLLIEEWFKKHHPNEQFDEILLVLRRLRKLIVELGHVREGAEGGERMRNDDPEAVEEMRWRLASVAAQIKHMHFWRALNGRQGRKAQLLFDHVGLFLCDAQRIIGHVMQKMGLTIPPFSFQEEEQLSFWTNRNQKDGSRSLVLEEPLKGTQGSVMEKIYNSNRFN
jgi:hypothetical protein